MAFKTCWRCEEALKEPVEVGLTIINCNPHALPSLDIKMRVPANICGSCQYALKLRFEHDCQCLVLRKKIARSP